jgi:nicotinamide riboside transporter PnuC
VFFRALAIGPRILVRGVGFGALGLIAATLFTHMNIAAEVILLVFVLAPVVPIGVVFVWGARKDGQEDRAVQARLSIRRRTRLGR